MLLQGIAHVKFLLPLCKLTRCQHSLPSLHALLPIPQLATLRYTHHSGKFQTSIVPSQSATADSQTPSLRTPNAYPVQHTNIHATRSVSTLNRVIQDHMANPNVMSCLHWQRAQQQQACWQCCGTEGGGKALPLDVHKAYIPSNDAPSLLAAQNRTSNLRQILAEKEGIEEGV